MLCLPWAAGGGALLPATAKIMSLPESLSAFHSSLLLGHFDPGWGTPGTESRVLARGLLGAAQALTLPH